MRLRTRITYAFLVVLALILRSFTSKGQQNTDIEEWMIGQYNKEYENTAEELFTEYVVAAFPGEKIICDGEDYGFSASEYIKNVDKAQQEKTPQSRKKSGESSSVDKKTEKQKKEKVMKQMTYRKHLLLPQ